MHPILASPGRIGLYVLQWTPVAALLAYLFVATGHLGWGESAALAGPLALFFAFVCLSPWYMCHALPFGTPAVKLAMNHSISAAAAGALWVAAAIGLGAALSSYFPSLNTRITHMLPLLFGIGVILYLLAISLHYVMLSVRTSREALEREQEARILAREAELKALKAQINPHFLFNSLNSISALTTVDGTRARQMCIGLSDFLRSTLRLAEMEEITLADELALARTYLGVEQVRFGGRLAVLIEEGAGCGACRVPALVLQPLVENAVKHGIASLLEGGLVRIEARCERGRLWVTVENPFDPDHVPAPKSGLGLVNVRNRLKVRYDDAARLSSSVEREMFRAEITLPCGEPAGPPFYPP